MIRKTLGETIDIHCGGQDLVFPHHENEIAQSECASGKPFVRYWVHNGFITVDDEKMSKSLGNFFTVRDVAKRFPYSVIRFFLLSAHYRMPINYNYDMMVAARNGLQRIRNCVENLAFVTATGETSGDMDDTGSLHLTEAGKVARDRFVQALEDDLNTADALAAVFDLVRAANTAAASDEPVSTESLRGAEMRIRELCDVLGIDLAPDKEEIPEEILRMVEERADAKKARDYALADRLRDQVKAQGFVIEDTPQGPKVSRA